jgi:hypothetical protein
VWECKRVGDKAIKAWPKGKGGRFNGDKSYVQLASNK